MHELELDAADSAELLELIEGKAGYALTNDAIARLYDALSERPLSAACRWRLTEDERQELLQELEECAQTIERAVLDLLVTSLQTAPSSPDQARTRETSRPNDFVRLRPAK
jgi:hypothetical protein